MSAIFHRRTAKRVSSRQALLLSAAVSAAFMQCAGASAQTQGGSTTTVADNVETIVVTAQKRSEQLKNVPISKSVLNQKYLDAIGADSLETFALTVPGLQVQTFGPGQTRITIRGVSPDEQTGVTAVSYYLDEIPVTSAGQRTQPELYLYDTNQVEVLRGPQGTLWGEGAMGGMVHITTNKPNTEDYEASALADVYSIDNGGTGYKLDAMANIPIVQDVLAVRVVVEDRYNAGWITDTIKSIPDPTLNPPARYVTSAVDKDANHSHDSTVRAQVRFTPTSHLTVDVSYLTNDINAATTNLGDVNAYNNVDLGLRPSKDVSELANLTAAYVFDGITVTSSSSYTSRRTDSSVFQEPILLGSTVLSTFKEITPDHTKTFTQELRAVSDTDQPFRWTVGAYYRNGFDNSATTATGDAPSLMLTDVPIFGFTAGQNYNTYAIFGQAEYDFLPFLTGVVGGRWFSISQSLGPAPVVHSTANGWTPLVTLRGKISDEWMAYGTFSEGYRPGGFNQNAGPLTYAPDKTKNYEIGTKYYTPNNRLSLSADAFYIDWSNMQFTQLSSGGFFTFVGNANRASSRGLEFTGDYHWDNGFWTQLNASWTDAHLDSQVLANLGGKTSPGTPLPAVPPYLVSATAGYNTELGGGYGLQLSGVVSFVGSQHTKLEENGSFTLPGYGTFIIGSYLHPYSSGNLRAEVTKDNYSLALYINNVWNNDEPDRGRQFLPDIRAAVLLSPAQDYRIAARREVLG